jgi:hypothetical protein
MKVHLIKTQTIEVFVKANVQSKSSFEDWLEKVKHAEEVACRYASHLWQC